MHCPNCGIPTLVEQEFCRVCGTGLTINETRQFRPQVWGLAMLMLMFAGLMIAMTGKMVDLRWLTFTGVFLCMGGMFSMAAFAMYRQTRPKKRKRVRAALTDSLERADTTNKLLPISAADDFIPSVTDATTNLLTPSAVNIPSEHSAALDRKSGK